MDQKKQRVQYLVALAVSLSAVAMSASYAWTTPVIPKLYNNEAGFKITDNEISWMVAMASPGGMVGSLVARVGADTFGRRATLLASGMPYIIGTAFAVCATRGWMLYLARCFWGCACGMINVISTIYLAEIADKEIRGTLSAGNRLMSHFGGFLIFTIGSFITFQTLNYMLMVLPICYFTACWWIPETPYFLLKEGRVDEARKELMKLQSQKKNKVLEDQLLMMRSDVKREMSRSGSAKELFTGKQYRKALIISLGLKVTQIFAGTIPIQQYLGRIILDSRTEMSVPTALTIFGAARFIVSILSSVLVDKVGRRPLLIITYFAAGLFLGIVGSYFFYQDKTLAEDVDSRPFRFVIFIGIICFILVSTLGFDTLIFVVPGEIFPLNVKSIAMTMLNILGAVLAFGSIKAYQLFKDYTGLYAVFWFYAAFAFAGAVFSFYFVPETKGMSLREIQMELQGSLFDETNANLSQVVTKQNSSVDIGTELEELKERNRKS